MSISYHKQPQQEQIKTHMSNSNLHILYNPTNRTKNLHLSLFVADSSGWWFQPTWKKFVSKLGSSSPTRGEDTTT